MNRRLLYRWLASGVLWLLLLIVVVISIRSVNIVNSTLALFVTHRGKFLLPAKYLYYWKLTCLGDKSMRERAVRLLKAMLGAGVVFREGQWEAIESIINRKRTLVVQRTGWGKSIVYFIATKLLRDQGAGPTILISPLLSLMRNQIENAARIGIRAESINSQNEEDWEHVKSTLVRGECDVLLVSPERLANFYFLDQVLPLISSGIGIFVVDEAHCISDWGHDFRPDYRRIVRIVNNLPSNVPVIATTATANDRVVNDIKEQLGQNLSIFRGPLKRDSLRLQTIRLADQSERLAWLVANIPKMNGSGIIYCLTVADCDRVARWLQEKGINALEYHGKLGNDLRKEREQKLLDNEIKALVATVALGMGFDKPDLGFVVHYQRPGSIVAYYQQIGRAGRALDNAYAILLNGREDDEIQDYFINTAFPGADEMDRVVRVLNSSQRGLKASEIMLLLNISQIRLEKCLKMLQIDEAISKNGTVYSRTLNPWQPDIARSEQVTAQRKHELRRMQDYVNTDMCLMKFVSLELGDPYAGNCGRCKNCCGEGFFSEQVGIENILEATQFLRGNFLVIEPRKQWPPGGVGDMKGKISGEHRNQEGYSLCMYGDAGWGRLVREDKYEQGYFRDELVFAAVDLIKNQWNPYPFPVWVTAVPSLRHPNLVPDFAKKVAEKLGIPFNPVLVKVKSTPQQKTMKNSFLQADNVIDCFEIQFGCPEGPVLLIDDMVDSRWTFTVCGMLLSKSGSGLVYPFAIANTAGGGDIE
ncbi:ATP-dependent DNA helicase, RecQ family [Desulfofarcimen acetoxidans DSM 771]|uniref:DNA 3'-5' helicase n=1 Tax=Desulfofarcimen acetoxidans (strain ATCC 49208 / DSM 771 / KCTC 5769 / VKM B-1644 / 5575) TaxID=485916 RepID=C8W6B1_DESAS|nr:ATP-dependent DNA helicase RecQ [Desulfofarcimen acetoxidans]ACV62200.1 ATP-dependent DNA helicase, RecQ family [Desulfofarcimen acetoxidans DSM 771]